MKIVTTYHRNVDEDSDEDTRLTVAIATMDGQIQFSIGHGEPEDMTLGRDLSSAYAVPEMLKAAYEAGARGEPLEEAEGSIS